MTVNTKYITGACNCDSSPTENAISKTEP